MVRDTVQVTHCAINVDSATTARVAWSQQLAGRVASSLPIHSKHGVHSPKGEAIYLSENKVAGSSIWLRRISANDMLFGFKWQSPCRAATSGHQICASSM